MGQMVTLHVILQKIEIQFWQTFIIHSLLKWVHQMQVQTLKVITKKLIGEQAKAIKILNHQIKIEHKLFMQVQMVECCMRLMLLTDLKSGRLCLQ